MKRSPIFLIIWKIFSLFCLSVILSCSSADDPVFLPDEGKIPDEEADSISVIVTTDNFIDYQMTAVYMYKYYDTKQTFADTVYVEFYQKDGTVETTLKCDRAEIDDSKNTITCFGNVVVVSQNGTMKAPLAELNRNTEQIIASAGVQLIRGENVLFGDEMISDMKLDVVEIIKVSGEGRLDEEDLIFQ